MIKITAPRTTISSDFMQEVTKISHNKIMTIKNDAEFLDGIQRKCFMKDMGPVVMAHSQIIKGDGLDAFVTRLRALPYTEFRLEEIEGFKATISSTLFGSDTLTTEPHIYRYLVGITKPVTLENEIRVRRPTRKPTYEIHTAKWDMGCYKVMVPIDLLAGAKGEGYWHFVPVSMENSYYARHPHHHAGKETSSSYWWQSKTCWGSFGPIINSLRQAADIVELFRTLYVYLGRYNGNSLLTSSISTANYPFAKEIL